MLMLLSCGRAKDSEDQTRPNIKPPEYPTTAKLNLGSTIASTQSYNGALLIWHNAVTAKQILPIGEGTRKSRLAKAKLLKFERDVHDPYVLELATKIKTLTTEIQTITEAQLEANRGALKQNFAGWFENSINVLETEKKIDAAGKLQAQKLFGMFCEAQIIAFAADPTLSLISYKHKLF